LTQIERGDTPPIMGDALIISIERVHALIGIRTYQKNRKDPALTNTTELTLCSSIGIKVMVRMGYLKLPCHTS